MKNIICLALLLILPTMFGGALAQPREGLFAGGYAAVDFRHHLWTTNSTTDFVRQSFVGDFALNNEYYIAHYKTWSVVLTSNIQFLWGGLKQRKAKLYAGSFRINLAYQHVLPFYDLYLKASAFHVSTHYIDPIDAASIDEARDLQQINIEVEDVNLIRLEIGQEEPNYAWSAGTQPLRMNFFLLAEPKEMFAHDAFTPYDRRFYTNALATVWRNDNFRIAMSEQTDLEQRIRFLIKLVGSTKLGDTPRHDRIQVSLAYEGGIEPNHIVIVPQSGIGRDWWFLEAAFFY